MLSGICCARGFSTPVMCGPLMQAVLQVLDSMYAKQPKGNYPDDSVRQADSDT